MQPIPLQSEWNLPETAPPLPHRPQTVTLRLQTGSLPESAEVPFSLDYEAAGAQLHKEYVLFAPDGSGSALFFLPEKKSPLRPRLLPDGHRSVSPSRSLPALSAETAPIPAEA